MIGNGDGHVDLADPELYAEGDPVRAWALLRREAPVYRNVRPDGSWFWAVTTHQLVGEVLRDNASFTSEPGMRLDTDPEAARAAAGKMLIVTDPPRHGRIRGIINSAFTPKMVRRLEKHMHETVDRALDAALTASVLDLTDLAARLPLSVICDLLGVPRADWDLILDRTRTAFGETVTGDRASSSAVAAHAELLAYCANLLEERRKRPGEDLISTLAGAVVDGEPLTDEEILLNCDGLISGGNETTRHATTAGVLALARSERQWARLRDEVNLVDDTVAEILRFTSPALHVLRTARRDLRLGGAAISAGDRVAVWLPSANRDEHVFPDGDRFDPARDARRHLTFGGGGHFCLGAALATLELRVFFRRLVSRVARVEPTGPVRRLRSNLIWGIESVPVRLHERRGRTGRPTAPMLAHQLVEAQVDRSPDAPAVLTASGPITYRELDVRANRLAQLLREHGVGPEILVGICLEHTEDVLVAVLAVWKAGGAYVPLDPTYPTDRLRTIMHDAPARVVLAHRATAGILPMDTNPLILDELTLNTPVRRPVPAGSPDNLSHVIFTSGSTGRPKGVAGTHAGVINQIEVFARKLALAPDDLMAAFAPLGFDPSMVELLVPLSLGARVTIVDGRTAGDISRLRSRLAADGVTVLQTTTARWKLLMAAGGVAHTVRLRLTGGEALPRDLADELRMDGATVWDLYGPTETTVWTTISEVLPEPGPVPLGRPIAGTRLYVLDSNLDELPVGETGEVHIGGIGVTRGYYRRPELTAERFVPDPFGKPGSRMYRTGDLARRRPDGRLDFRGRADHQVKIRGYRIELGEVEATLREHRWVRDAVVTARGEDALTAYVVPREAGTELWPMLRSWLRTRLPEYMVPGTGLTMAAFPLNANGKVDRAALPAARGRDIGTPYAAPRTAMERVVSTIWRELLGVGRVGLHDNFFDVGGNSMLLMRMRTRLQEVLGREVDVLAGLRHPTVHTLAQYLATGQAASVRSAPTPADRRLTGLDAMRDRRRRSTGGGS